MFGFASGTEQTVVPDSYKSSWWHMHQEPADKFNSGKGAFLPLTVFPVILHIKGNCAFIHTDNTMIADSDSVSIFAQVINDGLSTIKSFLAMRNPLFFIADVQQFLEGVMVANSIINNR